MDRRILRILYMSRTAAAALAIALLCAGAVAQGVDDEQATEYQVKAAFLYKFGNYIEWPGEVFASGDSPIVIGVLHAEDVGRILTEIVQGRTVHNRPVEVRILEADQPLTNVHVLFIGREAEAELPMIISDLRDDSVLIVTESDNSISAGSIINFVVADARVRFDVALGSADRRKLSVSARLLSVARKVYGEQS